jgi:hypothetical protein
VDALHNHAMGPTEFHSPQFAGAQKLIDRAAADIEHLCRALDGNCQSILEVDGMNVTAFTHTDEVGATSRFIRGRHEICCADLVRRFFVAVHQRFELNLPQYSNATIFGAGRV